MLLYTIKEFYSLIINYLAYHLTKRVDKQIIRIKEINDGILKKGFQITRKKNNFFIRMGNTSIALRGYTTDYEVFNQIYIEEEYLPVIKIIHEQNLEIKNIIDCGANIGLSSIYFKKKFPLAKICAIEPVLVNFKAAKNNFERNGIKDNIILGAIWSNSTYLGLDYSFRKGKEWSISTTIDSDKKDVEAFSILDIMSMQNLKEIDILKIDVEGAERRIFDKNVSDLSFLKKTKIIVIEIHDEFNCREMINRELNNYGFEYFESGELTIGIKMNLNGE